MCVCYINGCSGGSTYSGHGGCNLVAVVTVVTDYINCCKVQERIKLFLVVMTDQAVIVSFTVSIFWNVFGAFLGHTVLDLNFSYCFQVELPSLVQRSKDFPTLSLVLRLECFFLLLVLFL